jgi:hypothetical protein
MRRLTYALKFIRPASATSAANPIVATSNCVVTITPVGGTGEIGTLGQFETASVLTQPTFNQDGSFTERGVVTFGDPEENNTLSFSSIHFGYLNPYKCPETPYTAGTVMWGINGGTGFFEGATGAITSNFLVDASNPNVAGELIAYHYGVSYLP